MKKSKVIIPAMAMILFSTAASISGTVAWFTASRVFTTGVIGDFSVKSIDGNLTGTMLPGIGTEGVGDAITTGEYGSLQVTANNYLIDASFDHTTLTAYRKSRDAANSYDARGTLGAGSATMDNQGTPASLDVVNKWLYKTITTGTSPNEVTSKYYIAFTWQIKISYDFGSESKPVDIFFDALGSEMTGTNQTGATGTMDTKKGFRIAFIGNGNSLVWGGLADETSRNRYGESPSYSYKYEYVHSTSAYGEYSVATNVGDGSNGNVPDFFTSTVAGTKAEDEAVANANAYRADRVASIAVPGSGTTGNAVITCVAWYEGADPNVINDSKLQTCAANMTFYARSQA